jgi:hypothetical protein
LKPSRARRLRTTRATRFWAGCVDKQFHGDPDATSKGEMLSAGTNVRPAGYVAIERRSGTLQSQGQLRPANSGTMTRVRRS